MMHIKRFDEKKKAEPTEEVGQEMTFDSTSIDSTPVGFKSQLELPSDSDLAEIKKKIKGAEVVGLGKIKKFEDFSLEIEIAPEGNEEEYDPYSYKGCGCCPVCTGEKDCECGCPECNCPEDEDEFCDSCDCAE